MCQDSRVQQKHCRIGKKLSLRVAGRISGVLQIPKLSEWQLSIRGHRCNECRIATLYVLAGPCRGIHTFTERQKACPVPHPTFLLLCHGAYFPYKTSHLSFTPTRTSLFKFLSTTAKIAIALFPTYNVTDEAAHESVWLDAAKSLVELSFIDPADSKSLVNLFINMVM